MKVLRKTAGFVALCVFSTNSFADRVFEANWDRYFIPEAQHIIKIPSYRSAQIDEKLVVSNLASIRDYLKTVIDQFNKKYHTHISFFEWSRRVKNKKPWVFGFRLGNGDRKILLISHLDTVSPGFDNWNAFQPRIENRILRGKSTAFLTGRGSIDNKGPAIALLVALRSIAQVFRDRPQPVTIEVIFDTSEETGISTWHYLKQQKQKADYGVVFDAYWCIRAEKGIERPVFTIHKKNGIKQPDGVYLGNFSTSPGPVNKIPDWASVEIRTGTRQMDAMLAAIKQSKDITNFIVKRHKDFIELRSEVKGAQHAAAAYANQLNGRNPITQLAHILSPWIAEGKIRVNELASMMLFIDWTWGLDVLGNKHKKLLYASDRVFRDRDGTTYALTRLNDSATTVELKIDIRYATGHHRTSWTGKDGLLPGKSRFDEIFKTLLARFHGKYSRHTIVYRGRNLVAPDIRNPKGKIMSRINRAYRSQMGTDCTMYAIGGGTDAKGHDHLVAAGALLFRHSGPPVNFHGRLEAAPIEHLKTSSRIIFSLLKNEMQQDP